MDRDSKYIEQLENAKRASPLQLLFKCSRLANDRALARVHQRTGITLRPAHTNLFPHIDHEGTRLTDLAARLGISKQAIAQLVAELVDMGALERIPDPLDGRAKLIRFSRQGGSWVMSGLEALNEVAEELAAEIGEDRMAALHDILLRLEKVL